MDDDGNTFARGRIVKEKVWKISYFRLSRAIKKILTKGTFWRFKFAYYLLRTFIHVRFNTIIVSEYHVLNTIIVSEYHVFCPPFIFIIEILAFN